MSWFAMSSGNSSARRVTVLDAVGRAAAALLVATALIVSACAPKVVPSPVVTTPQFPDFIFPTIPSNLVNPVAANSHQRAWLFLQAGDLRTAEREFGLALKSAPTFYPSDTGLGYVGLAQRDYKSALTHFDRAIALAPAYVPALVGRGEVLLATDRENDALGSFEAALAVDGTLVAVRRRVEVLRFRVVQEYVDAARSAASAGRLEVAREWYLRAIAASPDSAFLYRELAILEQQQNQPDQAFEHATKVIQLDPQDARAHTIIGDVHEARGNLTEAIAAYELAYRIEAGPEIESKLARARAAAKLALLPPQYRAIPRADAVSRGDLAALLGVRLDSLLQMARGSEGVVITDMRGHWAAPWILPIARAGVMEVYANHTFQPNTSVRRAELGQVASRLLNLIASRNPTMAKPWQDARGTFSDLGPGNLNYQAASRAVAAGVLPVFDGGAFQLGRLVTGAEAIAAVARLEQLAQQAAPQYE